MIVETRTEPCGMLSYSKLAVPYDWQPKKLNRCECGRDNWRWSLGRGHECECGRSCNKACT
jgi:hypothetical protein